MENNLDSITVSVEGCGKYIQITNSDAFDSPCKINFKPEQVRILSQRLSEARKRALELRESAMNMVNEGGPV